MRTFLIFSQPFSKFLKLFQLLVGNIFLTETMCNGMRAFSGGARMHSRSDAAASVFSGQNPAEEFCLEFYFGNGFMTGGGGEGREREG